MTAGQAFKCVVCGEDKPDDGTAVYDKSLLGPACGECHYRTCLAAKWMARGYVWKTEDGDEARKNEGPCSNRPMITTDVNQFNFKRFQGYSTNENQENV